MDSNIKELKRQMDAISRSIDLLAGTHEVLLFKDFALDYLQKKINNPTLRQATKDGFENQVRRHLIPRFGALPLEKVTNAEWGYWVTETRAKEKGITRFFNSRKVLAEIMIAAQNDGHIQKAPKFDDPDEPKDVGRALSEKEILAILWKAQRPFRFIFYCFWRMGCRPREILRWEWSMLRWNEPGKTWINIPARISKTGRTRSIALHPAVSRRLAIRNGRRNSLFVFPSRYSLARPQLSYASAWNRACVRARVEAMPYDLRRTFVTRCAAEGMQLLYVAKHLDTSTKMIESTYAKAQADIMEKIVK